MEKNLCSFRDNAGGECGADPRDSTNKCEVVKLQSCLKEISNLWHCRQMDAECKRQQQDEVNCLRKTSSDPHKPANFRLLLQNVGLAKKSLGHAVADLDDATAEGDVASATQELHRRAPTYRTKSAYHIPFATNSTTFVNLYRSRSCLSSQQNAA